MSKTMKIGYVHLCKTKASQEEERKIIFQKLPNTSPIHIEINNKYKMLFDIIELATPQEKIEIYLLSINSIGKSLNDIIINLAKIREKKEVSLYFILEDIDTTKIKIDSIIKLLKNIHPTGEKAVGRPLGSMKKYELFCEYYPEIKSKSELARILGVTRATIYKYIRIINNK
ncbi:HTH domain-containing protein [Bacteroides fragilis]|uniref:HTH domain-containing protein n=1 Tax=Bacteroides fragilis TaxID=817 RepID=UPI001C6FD17B|nr:HTH domain-containing protein [Bacteroides fragilis]MBW9277652.1 HTH domain-containing protein [Bacteroides fragilis]